MSDRLKLYHAVNSPNSRRVRIFLVEKGLEPTLISVDLGAGEQHSEAYRAINPRLVVPALVLEDGTTIAEVPAIMRYLDEAFPDTPLLGATSKDKGLVVMWERFAELEGFAPVMEGVRNKMERLKGRAIAGPHGYAQIPGLVDRSVLRVMNFLADLNERLEQVPFVAGERFLGSRYHCTGDHRFREGARYIDCGGAPSANALEGRGFGAAEHERMTRSNRNASAVLHEEQPRDRLQAHTGARPCPKGISLLKSRSPIRRPTRFTARAFRTSSQRVAAGFSCAAKTRNRWMASSRTADGLSSSSIAPRP
jgi:glutathione S-transferase